MAKGISPTQRSLKLLRDEERYPTIVEKYNHFIKIRQDAWGFVDLIALSPKQGEILFVQTTTMANLPARREKSFANPNLKAMLEAGGVFELHGWRKLKVKGEDGKKGKGMRWECKRERYGDVGEIGKEN